MSHDTRPQVAKMIAEGLSNKMIAQATGRSEKTIKAHCTTLYREYGVKSRLQFALKYQEMQRAKETPSET